MPPACSPEAITIESVRFRSGDWLLSGELAYSVDAAPVALGLMAGPHPLLGGTMANNVVRGLGDGLAHHGLVTLRFDYHGAGASEGPDSEAAVRFAEFWHSSRTDAEAGYARDLRNAATFLLHTVSDALPLALIGYSFGCSLLADLPELVNAAPRVLVAPTVGTHSYEALVTVTAPKLVIAPLDDFAAEAALLADWFDRLAEPKLLLRPRLDGHFFRGHEDWLVETIRRFLLESSA
jgi:alpha/beta superfamily hydrolase